jgi:peptide/nickel transport system permease protein
MFFRAIGAFDTPVIVASVVIFAYLLAVTVFFLDILYAILDPRVKLGAEGAQ